MGDLTRRSFVGFVATTAVACGIGGVGVALTGESDPLRPPGAQSESDLLAACVKCDRCRSACHTGAIAVAHVEDGLLRARTPVLDFHQGSCDFCDKCRQACPTGAIKSFDHTTDKIGVAIIQTDRCIAYIEGCRECVDACPYGAMSLDEADHPVVDPQVCNGCGVCENICPALVYRSFAGGTRHGVVVETWERYQELGATTYDGGDAA